MPSFFPFLFSIIPVIATFGLSPLDFIQADLSLLGHLLAAILVLFFSLFLFPQLLFPLKILVVIKLHFHLPISLLAIFSHLESAIQCLQLLILIARWIWIMALEGIFGVSGLFAHIILVDLFFLNTHTHGNHKSSTFINNLIYIVDSIIIPSHNCTHSVLVTIVSPIDHNSLTSFFLLFLHQWHLIYKCVIRNSKVSKVNVNIILNRLIK